MTDLRPLPDAAVAPETGWCSPDAFCWVVPRPQGNGLLAVDGADASDVVAVGAYGTALRYDGAAWSRLPTGVTDDFEHVWVANDHTAWLAHSSPSEGESYLMRLTDDGVARVALPEKDALVALHGQGDAVVVAHRRAVYRAGQSGFDLVFEPPSADLTVVDVLVTEATTWVLTATPWIPDGPEPTTVLFEVGEEGHRLDAEVRTDGLAELGDGTVVAYGRGVHRVVPGSGFESISTVSNVRDVGGSSVEDMVVLADEGTLVGGVVADASNRYRGLWGSADGRLMTRVGERGAISVRTAGTWSDVGDASLADPYSPLEPDRFGRVPTELWVGRAATAWASSPVDAWRVTQDHKSPMLEHWDGQSWTPVREATYRSKLHGSGADDVWLLMGHRQVLHFDGAAWVEHDVIPPPAIGAIIWDVWARAPGDTYLVGRDDAENGVLWHWDGEAWATLHTMSDAEMLAIDDGEAPGEFYVTARQSDTAYLNRWQGLELVESTALPGPGTRVQSVWVDRTGLHLLRGHELLERAHNGDAWRSSDVGFSSRWSRVWIGSTGTWVHDGAMATLRR